MQKLQEQISVKTKSCAIIAVIHELSGLVQYSTKWLTNIRITLIFIQMVEYYE